MLEAVLFHRVPSKPSLEFSALCKQNIVCDISIVIAYSVRSRQIVDYVADCETRPHDYDSYNLVT